MFTSFLNPFTYFFNIHIFFEPIQLIFVVARKPALFCSQVTNFLANNFVLIIVNVTVCDDGERMNRKELCVFHFLLNYSLSVVLYCLAHSLIFVVSFQFFQFFMYVCMCVVVRSLYSTSLYSTLLHSTHLNAMSCVFFPFVRCCRVIYRTIPYYFLDNRLLGNRNKDNSMKFVVTVLIQVLFTVILLGF